MKIKVWSLDFYQLFDRSLMLKAKERYTKNPQYLCGSRRVSGSGWWDVNES